MNKKYKREQVEFSKKDFTSPQPEYHAQYKRRSQGTTFKSPTKREI